MRPGLGYYSGGAAKLGRDGDFTTAPEISRCSAPRWRARPPLLSPKARPTSSNSAPAPASWRATCSPRWRQLGVPVDSYTIIELSGELRARQQEALKDFPQVRWLDGFPDGFRGVVLANEVLDAMPVELVIKEAAGLARQYGDGRRRRFALSRPSRDAALLAQIGTRFPTPDSLQDGYLTEVHPVACGFMRSLAEMFKNGKGAAILFDYGFPAHEYYFDERSGGTLMCHYRHHAHPDPFFLPGLQDITAHVDFTAMALAAQDAGLDVLAI
jgi:SAM-dependent MidA family methyltransferase